jgi:hypothetical protein
LKLEVDFRRLVGEEISEVFVPFESVKMVAVFSGKALRISEFFEDKIGNFEDGVFGAFFEDAMEIPDEDFHSLRDVEQEVK